jgi:DNA-binding HxlR family transcriptional regulator
MKIARLHILSLLVGALVAGDRASAAPDEAAFNKTQQEARVEADKWRDEIKQSFQVSRGREVHLKAMQDTSAKLRAFLLDKPCRDGAQAKEIESYIHGRFHTLYGGVVADIKHGVDLNCRDHKLAVVFWITGFTPTAATVAAEKGAAAPENSNTSTHEIEAATKRIFGNWATAVAPSLTDKSKKIEDIRASAIRASELTRRQLDELSCPDGGTTLTAVDANLVAATKELKQDFTDYLFYVLCDGKKLGLIYNFASLKRKGPGFTPTAATVAAEKGATALGSSNQSTHEIEAATKRIFGNWATAVAPSLTDKSKKIEDIRASAIRASELTRRQLDELSCPDGGITLTAVDANLVVATKELKQDFTDYLFYVLCDGKKLGLIYNFTGLKRKGT